MLAGRGHEVITAPDAKVALGLLAEHRPDVALVAIDLPRIDGCELLQLSQRIDPPLPTRFIAMAGTDPDVARARQAGFANHVTKPIVSSAVVLALETE